VAIERIKYRKSFGQVLASKRNFVVVKGEVGQAEHETADYGKLSLNENVGFKCLHYSVIESSKKISIVVLKKKEAAAKSISFGIRTVEDTAQAGEDYTAIDQRVDMPRGTDRFQIEIPIVDDDSVEPDEDFYVELYDLDDKSRLQGDDTRCRVTIIDDD